MCDKQTRAEDIRKNQFVLVKNHIVQITNVHHHTQHGQGHHMFVQLEVVDIERNAAYRVRAGSFDVFTVYEPTFSCCEICLIYDDNTMLLLADDNSMRGDMLLPDTSLGNDIRQMHDQGLRTRIKIMNVNGKETIVKFNHRKF